MALASTQMSLKGARGRPAPGIWISRVGLFLLFIASPLMEATILNRGRLVQGAFIGVTLGVAAVTLLLAANGRRLVYLPAIVFGPAVLSLLALVVNTVASPASNSAVLSRLSIVFFWISVAWLVSASEINSREVWVLLLAGFGVACLLTAFTPEPYRDCDVFKCGGFGELFMGPFRSENLMAQFSAVALLAATGPLKGRLRFISASMAIAVLFATVSRTSALAIVSAFLVIVLLKALRKRPAKTRVAAAGAVALAMSSVGVWAVLSASADDFSDRGWFWHQAIQALHGHWVFGRGVDQWTALQETGYLPPLFPHSQYLLMLFWAGIVGLSAWIVFLLRTLRHLNAAASEVGRHGSAFVILLCVLGITETVWNPLALDARTPMIVALIALAAAGDAARRGDMAETATTAKSVE